MKGSRKGIRRWASAWPLIAAVAVIAAIAGVRLAPGVWPGQASHQRPPAASEVSFALKTIFATRADALAKGDEARLAPLYEADAHPSAKKALEHELRKLRYVKAWASKRQMKITGAETHLEVKSISLERDIARAVAWQSLKIAYVPSGRVSARESTFGIRTRHNVSLARKDDGWVIRSDEYTDPLGEDTLVPEVAPASLITAPDAQASGAEEGDVNNGPHFESAAAARPSSVYNRRKAVAYADRYSGVKMGPGMESGYNPDYRDYTDLGGDCTNFVSQVLGDINAGGIPTDSTWHNTPGEGGSKAWVETSAFASYLAGSGIARLIAKGSFGDVQARSPAHSSGALGGLEPGDILAYEEKGEIQHFAVIAARDPSGYPLVNTHTADRYHVPWDLGWDKNTVFWLYRIVR